MVVLRIGAQPLLTAAKIDRRNPIVISFHLRQVAPLSTLRVRRFSGRTGIVSVNLLEPCLRIVLDSSWLLVGARNNPGIPAFERLLDFTP